jgi:hypothetical protein
VTGGIRSNPMHSLAIRTPRAKRETLFTSDLLIKGNNKQPLLQNLQVYISKYLKLFITKIHARKPWKIFS